MSAGIWFVLVLVAYKLLAWRAARPATIHLVHRSQPVGALHIPARTQAWRDKMHAERDASDAASAVRYAADCAKRRARFESNLI